MLSPVVSAGAAEALNAAASPSWRRCSNAAELRNAVASIRAQQAAASGNPLIRTFDWLPFVYEVMPLDCDWVGEQLAAGNVWLLDSEGVNADAAQPLASCSNGGVGHSSAAASREAEPEATAAERQYRAVAVIAKSPEFRRFCAGVLAADAAALQSAVALVASQQKHFVCFVDLPEQLDQPALYKCTAEEERGSFYVFHKPM